MSNEKSSDRDFHLVVWGATGFTGSLVAEYLAGRYGTGGELIWAIGGRSQEKLEQVRAGLGSQCADLPILTGDSHDAASLAKIAKSAVAVVSTVGPFSKYGSELVAACVANGTHYCDITGEAHWIRRMIDEHEAQAAKTGSRIVHCCGFDSIPSDLGCYFLQSEMRRLHGGPCDQVRMLVRKMRGEFSGGTVSSMLNALEEAKADPEARRALGHPYGLNPAGQQAGPDGADQRGPAWDADVDSWTAPFVMAAINTKVVRRSNALMDYAYGRDFRYSEAMMTGRGMLGWSRAAGITGGLGGFIALASVPPTRALLNKMFLPQPGEGPSHDKRENGFFDLLLVGKYSGGVTGLPKVRVRGDRDPGYGSTSRMLGESAVCLALDGDRLEVGGGFWTPASSMGSILIDRLQANAGLSFELAD